MPQEVVKPRVSCCETEKGRAPPPHTVFLPKMFNLNLTVRKQSGPSKRTYFATQLAWVCRNVIIMRTEQRVGDLS